MAQGNRNRRIFIRDLLALSVAGPQALRSFAATGVVEKRLAPIRRRVANPFVENGKPIVVVVHGDDFPAMLAKGMDTLVSNAVNGLNAMPPKGLCMSCSDEDIRGVVEYIVAQSQ